MLVGTSASESATPNNYSISRRTSITELEVLVVAMETNYLNWQLHCALWHAWSVGPGRNEMVGFITLLWP